MKNSLRQGAGLVVTGLLLTGLACPAAAQTQPPPQRTLPSDYQPPPATPAAPSAPSPSTPTAPSPSTPSTPAAPKDPANPGAAARAAFKAAKAAREKAELDKKLYGDKLGPLSLSPLTVVWSTFISGPPIAGFTADDSTFFIATGAKQVMAWDVKTGAARGTYADLAVVQPLAVDAGRLFVVLDQEVAAFDTQSNKPLWRLPTGAPVIAAPVVKAGWLILALDTGEIRAMRGDTGETVWHANFKAPVKTTPIIIGDRLYVAPQNNHLVALDLVSGQQLWDQTFDAFVTSLGAHGQRIFISTNRMFFGLDHAGEIKWKWRIGTEAIGPPVADDNNVYVAFADNTLRAFDENGGALQWRTALNYRPVSGPVLVGRSVLLPQIAPVLQSYEIKEGKSEGEFKLPVGDRALIVGQPVYVRGATFFGDTIFVPVAESFFMAARRLGPGTITPVFTDPGTVCPPLSMPGEQPAPTPTASATAAPPKA